VVSPGTILPGLSVYVRNYRATTARRRCWRHFRSAKSSNLTTRRPAGSRTSGGHLLLVVNPVRGPLASPFFFTGARNELQSPPSVDRDGGPRTRSKDKPVQNGLPCLGDNRAVQGGSHCSCGGQCNGRSQSTSCDYGTHGTRPSWGCTKIRLSPTQRSCNGDNSATSCKKNCSFAQYRGNTSPRLLGPMVRAREHFARL